MAYKALIGKQLNLAFNNMKDLAEEVIFHRKSVESFDFNELSPTSTEDPQVALKAVVISDQKSDSTKKLQLLFKSETLGTVTAFSQVDVAGTLWTVGPIVTQSRYVTLLQLYRGE